LWCGLPAVTCLGTTFAARVAASQLHAVGLPELVGASLADYEALALRLAREPAALYAVRDKLTHNRLAGPLFDTARFTRYLEAAYTTMWQRWQRGDPPGSFTVPPSDGL
jgi:predicted O-linked N-acetylglucosamine transferase (SPINDLY family)